LQIRKTKKDARLAKLLQMQDSGLSAPTPAGMAAASMLMTAGDNTYANIAMQQESAGNVGSATAQSKLEQLAAMVQGVMGNDPAVQTECTTQFCRSLSIEKNPPIQNVVDAGVVPRVGQDESKATGQPNQMAIFASEDEGLTKIEGLQEHLNDDINEKCIKIKVTYFGIEDEEDAAAVAPSMEGTTFVFGMDQQQTQGNFDFSQP
jgi:hypothetical protein